MHSLLAYQLCRPGVFFLWPQKLLGLTRLGERKCLGSSEVVKKEEKEEERVLHRGERGGGGRGRSRKISRYISNRIRSHSSYSIHGHIIFQSCSGEGSQLGCCCWRPHTKEDTRQEKIQYEGRQEQGKESWLKSSIVSEEECCNLKELQQVVKKDTKE